MVATWSGTPCAVNFWTPAQARAFLRGGGDLATAQAARGVLPGPAPDELERAGTTLATPKPPPVQIVRRLPSADPLTQYDPNTGMTVSQRAVVATKPVVPFSLGGPGQFLTEPQQFANLVAMNSQPSGAIPITEQLYDVVIAADRALNGLTGGDPRETISARIGREAPALPDPFGHFAASAAQSPLCGCSGNWLPLTPTLMRSLHRCR